MEQAPETSQWLSEPPKAAVSSQVLQPASHLAFFWPDQHHVINVRDRRDTPRMSGTSPGSELQTYTVVHPRPHQPLPDFSPIGMDRDPSAQSQRHLVPGAKFICAREGATVAQQQSGKPYHQVTSWWSLATLQGPSCFREGRDRRSQRRVMGSHAHFWGCISPRLHRGGSYRTEEGSDAGLQENDP